WREPVSELGHRLFEKIFLAHPKVAAEYHKALENSGGELAMCFQTSADYVRLPLEFLFDPIGDGGEEFLIRSHPLYRSFAGIRPNSSVLNPRFINRLGRDGKTLRVLLVSSNTPPAIASVDGEVLSIRESIQTYFEKAGLKVEFTCLVTKDATAGQVRDVL